MSHLAWFACQDIFTLSTPPCRQIARVYTYYLTIWEFGSSGIVLVMGEHVDGLEQKARIRATTVDELGRLEQTSS